ncbi:helix-turn-helix domain-containing protein [Pseudoroseomonas ludipueritiae]|uniref:Helix-turn-helix transcriptional regulator n=1 Tax=Pseudoroseomonas ludipueritiae TaxID=198093 RepID=A0ABR7RC17_9PROT|nr:AraC family transcriptional regulator [Pseudoroseomonas ludipueritiae]MBC9179293.1 helix-turn-helix transcriptional regulator [Pseudoroseomonas ludipueritiae]
MLHGMELGFGRSGAIWSNCQDRVAYERPEGHTLSLYIEGGEGTRRLGRKAGRGRPGAICIMPQAHSSDWEITDRFAFVHLYLPDIELRRSFTETFDRDARLMVLPDLSFCDAPHLAAALHHLASALARNDALAAEAATAEATAAALAPGLPQGLRQPSLKGGLPPHLRRRIGEYIEAHLDTPLRLHELAAMANLSAFHFQRMFRASHGVSPQGWIQRRRLECARRLLRGGTPVVQIATACGFSSQSHLTRVFKAATGTTPAAYRAAIRECEPRDKAQILQA